MNLKNFTPAMVFAVVALTAGPALAQQRDRGRDRGRSEGQAVQRGSSSRGGESPRGGRQDQSRRSEAQRPAQAPRQDQAPPADSRRGVGQGRPDGNRQANGNNNGGGRQYERQGGPRADQSPRGSGIAPRDNSPRGGYAPRAYSSPPSAPRSYSRPSYAPRTYSSGAYNQRGYAPRYSAPRYSVPRYYSPRPYVFRPRSRLSLGIYLGYGIPYFDTYRFPLPVYGYGAPSAPVYITPQSSAYGGILLDITPGDADVIVDGEFVGQVRDFDGTGAPLSLMVGRHHLELDAPDFEPLVIDVDVVPGQLVPYRGDLQPSRY